MVKRELDGDARGRAPVVPAIDLLDGRVVRLRQGRYDEVTEYAVDPLEAAAGYAAEGATLLHVIDLSAARDGVRPAVHDRIVRDLVDGCGMAVQIGGGIRSEADVQAALELGVARVLVGTLAAREPAVVGRLCADTARVAVAADVRDGTVRAAGWLEDTGAGARAFVERLADLGARDVVVPAIDRDGTGEGPDGELLAGLRPSVPGVLMAAGGIGNAAHVAEAVAAGADAVVVGRALYAGWLSLSEASTSVRSSPSERPS
jgi:phosphoribosylformimino-5-aminoimidazole carboxamide ribotide isomerase